jgi:hypothetical protein
MFSINRGEIHQNSIFNAELGKELHRKTTKNKILLGTFQVLWVKQEHKKKKKSSLSTTDFLKIQKW